MLPGSQSPYRRGSHRRLGWFDSVISFDRYRWSPIRGFRCGAGVAIAACIAFIGGPGAGALACIGAIYTGVASSNGIYRTRLVAMLASGFMLAFSTIVAGLVARNLPFAMLAVFATAFGTALFSPSSRAATAIGAQTTALMCVIIGLGLPPGEAVGNGLLVAFGSVVQLFMLLVVWRIGPRLAERRTIAEVFGSLAEFAGGLSFHPDDDRPHIPSALPFQEARSIMSEAEGADWGEEQENLMLALRRAEGIRAALVGFSGAASAYAAQGDIQARRARRIFRLVARALNRLSRRVLEGRFGATPNSLNLRTKRSAPDEGFDHWLDQISEMIQGCCVADTVPIIPRKTRKRPIPWKTALTKLAHRPDTAPLRSLTAQHALRYACTVEAAFVVSQFWNRSHSYWFPMTVALVLRQGYGTTFQRGLARLFGTIVGLGLADLVIHAFHPGAPSLEILAVSVTWLAFASSQASYALMTIAVTGFVVFEISAAGMATHEIVSIRFVASILGVAVALISYVLWPAWHWSEIWEVLRSATLSQIDYAKSVLAVSSSRESFDVLEEKIGVARALRIQAESLMESARLHPMVRDRSRLKEAEEVLLKLEQNAATILIADAERLSGRMASCERVREAMELDESILGTLEARGVRRDTAGI